MGVLWMGAFALYGMSASYLGAFGTSIGWGLFQIFMIMTATLSGVLTGEWRRAPRRAETPPGAGLTGLTGAAVLPALRKPDGRFRSMDFPLSITPYPVCPMCAA